MIRKKIIISGILYLLISTFYCYAQDEDKLINAAATGDYAKVIRYANKGVNINAKNRIGWTSLAYASKYNHFEIVKFLVLKGADLNKKINTGFTPLQIALNSGHINIAKFLVENKADLDIKDMLGMSAIAWASKHGNYDIVKYLAENGADINSTNSSGRTPLDIAKTEEIKEYLRSLDAKTGDEIFNQ